MELRSSRKRGHTGDEPSKLPYQLIKQITNDFDEKRILGSGGFGTVYKGVHESRGEIAVKVLHTISGLDDKKFHKEFDNLRGLKHQNIVELVGFCKESEEELAEFDGKQVTATRIHMALCFEYAHKGSLNEFISDENTGFNWPTRYRIIKGICEGLKYLRERLEYPIMHFDLKPGNILLDKDMVPKIADFGLSKLLGEENTRKTMSSIGTCGYWPPEYVKHQIISKEFDIFSLGVIIVKIMTGHEGYNRVVEMTTQKSVALVHNNWRKKLHQSHKLHQGRTPLLEVYCCQVKRCIEIALDCLKSNRQERPTIQDIVSSLNETETMISDQRLHIEKFNQEDHEESIPRSMSSSITSGPSSGRGEAIRALTFQEIIGLTDGFSEERQLAEGWNGKVYKGISEDGQVLAVKVLSARHDPVLLRWRPGHLIRFENQNIVWLAGYCYGKQSKLVDHKEGGYVYADEMQRIHCFEYLPNGSLDRHISDVHSGLDWHTRYRIIKGTCTGLRHLHHGFRRPICHFNIKPSNILLDENMQPKIDDVIYNFVPFIRRPYLPQGKVGSIEYMPPEFVEKQIVSEKYDIYSLGIVIIEIMTGNKYRLGSLEMSSKEFIDRVCVSWRKRLQETVKLTSVEGYCRQVKKCLEIALKCVEADRHKRPTIENIINTLNETETSIHSEPLLDVHPLELCFLPFIKKKAMISCSLRLDNKGNDRVAFMLVANSPKRYLTKKPLCGVVPPRCAYTLTLTIMPNKQLPALSTSTSSDSGGDFFTLYGVALRSCDLLDVDKDHVAVEYDNFFKKAGEEVQEVTLKVISCSDGIAPANEETSSSSEPTRRMVEIMTTPDAQQVSSIDMHPTEPWIITTHHVGNLRVWNCQTMAMLNSIQDVTVHAAKFIAREKWVVAGDGNGCIHVYSYDQNQCVESFDFDAHDGCITTLAVHPTDPFVLSSSSDDDDHLIKLWDWNKDWKCTRTFQGHTGNVTQVTFNPQNKDSFASTSWDGTVKIWSICSNDTSSIITLKLDEHGLCVDYFTRYNRQHLIVGCKDRTAQIWELGMKECVDNLEGHADRISAVKLHPELPILITGSLDGTVRVWNSTTYKFENIIGFNLGAVYAFGCIKGSTRIVVGCHQGIATMEISLPFPVFNQSPLSSFCPGCSDTATGFIFSASRGKSGGGGIVHEKARKRRFLTLQAKNSGSKLRHTQRIATVDSTRFTDMTAKLNKAMAFKFNISKASEGLVDTIKRLSLLDKPDSFCDLSKECGAIDLRVEVSDGAALQSNKKRFVLKGIA